MRHLQAGARRAAPSATAQPVVPVVPLVRSEPEGAALAAPVLPVDQGEAVELLANLIPVVRVDKGAVRMCWMWGTAVMALSREVSVRNVTWPS